MGNKIYNENSRVKIPALVHFARLGYTYQSIKQYKLAENEIDADTNIFVLFFHKALNKLNNREVTLEETRKIIEDFKLKLSGDDLGEKFYNFLINGYEDLKLMDFSEEDKNDYRVVTELIYKNEDEEFRPDITVLINGLPLSFMEVKKPNNKEGIQAEYERMNMRFSKKQYRRFTNITQFTVFSNNVEYDDTEVVPLSGSFYASSSYEKLFFNYFREEDKNIFYNLAEVNEQLIGTILNDNNLISIKSNPEFRTNLEKDTPANKIITSLYSKNRIKEFLKYGIVYVKKINNMGITEIQKHVMRYPQYFATKAIKNTLEKGIKKGIIWHTQGSGKTALSYFNVKYLEDYFFKKGKAAKFFFVVDRLELLEQASSEFISRGLSIEKVNSREEFIKAMQSPKVRDSQGKSVITVVNIQKFSEDSTVIKFSYDLDIQRIFFLDEAHRSYKPTGSFLSNLINSDKDGVFIGLTGTPLINNPDYKSTDVFGNYIHRYYYNSSIQDRYTLKLIREGIQTEYKEKLEEHIKNLEILQGSINKNEIYSHPKYVDALVEYITKDLEESKISFGDNTIGAMIVCDSSNQAKEIFNNLMEKGYINANIAIEKNEDFINSNGEKAKKAALILHDVDTKEIRKIEQQNFKAGNIDILVVFNMLLTGFDAPRLKKIYLGRIIKAHNLLQALTRVNRPYKKFRYGYVVDFADISKEFDKTNKRYFEELQKELGNEFDKYSNIFKTEEEIEKDIQNIKEKLFQYDAENLEIFRKQMGEIKDKNILNEIKKALEDYKALRNIIKLHGYSNLFEKLDIEYANKMLNEINNRISIINLNQSLSEEENNETIINMALDKINFNFKKIREEEMVIADAFQNELEKTRAEFERSRDPKSKEYITLMEELKRLFKKKNLEEFTTDEMKDVMKNLTNIKMRIKELNRNDYNLAIKYDGDNKFMRIHKRIKENQKIHDMSDIKLNSILKNTKCQIDKIIENNIEIMEKSAYFERTIMPVIIDSSEENETKNSLEELKIIRKYIFEEYTSEGRKN